MHRSLPCSPALPSSKSTHVTASSRKTTGSGARTTVGQRRLGAGMIWSNRQTSQPSRTLPGTSDRAPRAAGAAATYDLSGVMDSYL